MKCHSAKCSGDVKLTTFSGFPATECLKCGEYRIIPDGMVDMVKESLGSPVEKEPFKLPVRNYTVSCDLRQHYRSMRKFSYYV